MPDRVTTTTTSYPLAGQNSVTGDALVEPVMRQVIINPENQSTSVETDLDHGLPLVMSDVNGLFTRYEYDEYGRKPKITSPDKSYTQVSEHDWVKNDSKAPTTAQYYKKTVFESTSASESQQTPLTEYFDEHGNLLRTYQHRWHTDSKAVIVDYTYDRLGRLTQESIPYYEGQGYLNTVRSYVDNTQYLLKLSDYRGPTQDYEYDRYTVTRTDSDGHVHREERNAKNQIIQTENGDLANLSKMTYQFDDAGRIRRIIDHEGNVTTREYDSRDNMWSLEDPDRGTMNYEYDSYGALQSHTSARGLETVYTYDKLGRITEQSANDFEEIRVYDDKPNGKGMLGSVSYKKPGHAVHHRQTLSYDSLGRLSQNIECVGAEGEGCSDYTTNYDYDDYSRLETTTLPGGKEVYREYNNNILQKLKRGKQGSLIWEMKNMDARGRPFYEQAGNGVETRYTYNYNDDQGGMLSNIRVNNSSKDIMHRAYEYDPENAQLVMRRDMLPNVIGDFILPTVVETFTYDKHRRIETNDFNYGGTQSESFTYKYDELGNLKSKPDAGLENYTYGKGITVDNAGPHAIKSVDGRAFSYDASGNLLNDGEREARWKSFEKPEMLRKGSATIWFEYGAGNSRKRRRQGNFNTWYLNGGADVQIEQLTHNNNSAVTTKYHYMANGKVVGIDEETDSGTESRYLHSDRLGSASVLTDELGDVLEKMSYDIWGQVRSVTSGGAGSVLKSQYHTKGYTGHEALADVDLVHMNGRIYDPILGRFMSADPFVQFAYNSQSYNRYSYVLNSPLGWTDPSGYSVSGEVNLDENGNPKIDWSDGSTDYVFPETAAHFGGHDDGNRVGGSDGLNGSTQADVSGGSDVPKHLYDNPDNPEKGFSGPQSHLDNLLAALRALKNSTALGRGLYEAIVNRIPVGNSIGYMPATDGKSFGVDMSVPEFWTMEIILEEVKAINDWADKGMGKHITIEEALSEIEGKTPASIIAHEAANILGMSEAATILVVENAINRSLGGITRNVDIGDPMRTSDFTEQDYEVIEDLLIR